MKGNKILAVLVVLAMLLSTMVVLNKLGFDVVEKAGAVTVIGVDYYQKSKDGSKNILNNTDDELQEIEVGNTVTLEFNGELVTTEHYLYYPTYTSDINGYVQANWSRVSGSIDNDNLDKTVAFTGDYAQPGLWLVVPATADVAGDGSLFQLNMSSMKVKILTGTAQITGWFWVNSSSWTVKLSTDTVYYDKNDTLTITVEDGSGPVTSAGFIDIWLVTESGTPGTSDSYTLCQHKAMAADSDGMSWTLSKANIYSYTHSNGAGTYAVSAYGSSLNFETYAKYVYGDTATTSGKYGYNSTFGNLTVWSARFTLDATNSKIYNCWKVPVKYTGETTYTNTTYKYETCGPFAPPKYLAEYNNFTVAAGAPIATVTNDSQFWNDSYLNFVNITVTDYAGNDLNFNGKNLLLYNKTNEPSDPDSIPINPSFYNITAGLGWISISPNGLHNTWGRHKGATYWTTWAPKGKIYVMYAMHTVGNASEEWNGTSYFTLTQAEARFRWVDDDGDLSSDNTDGVIPYVPAIAQLPVEIEFKIQGDDYSYWGDGTAAETVTEAAENITISGNSLFTGTLDQFPGYADGWFDGTDTWTVPIIPTMGEGGGEITISVVAWNQSISGGDLTIGGGDYMMNGSIVAVTPSEFNIGVEDQTLTITTERADGTNMPSGTVYLYYLTDAGVPVGTLVGDCVDYDRTSTSNYEILFNTTQQTTNQTAQAGFSAIEAPRKLIIYADVTNIGYGYALVEMKPESDFKVVLSKSTILAGYTYDDFYINTTVIDTTTGNGTGTPESDDEGSFFIVVYDEEDNNVTDEVLSGGTYDYTDLIGSSSSFDDYSCDLTDLYITEPGTYTFYAYNNTHNSEGYNATLFVDQVVVSCDKDPLIWNYDENMSATFTVTYGGDESVSAGTLRIDNMSTSDDYNKTWVNTSFNGATDDNAFNDSIEIDEDAGLVDGVVTVNDITANYLDDEVAEQYITFWFQPDGGEYARAKGILPVSVPTVSVDKSKVSLGQTTNVVATVTGRGTELEDVFVGLHGAGITIATTNGTTDEFGDITFAILPTVQGKISIDVGEEGRTTDTEITVTNWAMTIDVELQVDEGTDFTVTITKTGTTTPVEAAYVVFTGQTGTKTTDATGEVTFSAPEVSSDRSYTISVTAEGYTPASTTITVINIPKLVISVDPEVKAKATFEVAVAKDTGDPVIGATVTFNGATYKTKAGGVATITAPDTEGDYPITAEFGTFEGATATITVTPGGGIPGFELVTLIAAIGVALILLRRKRN